MSEQKWRVKTAGTYREEIVPEQRIELRDGTTKVIPESIYVWLGGWTFMHPDGHVAVTNPDENLRDDHGQAVLEGQQFILTDPQQKMKGWRRQDLKKKAI